MLNELSLFAAFESSIGKSESRLREDAAFGQMPRVVRWIFAGWALAIIVAVIVVEWGKVKAALVHAQFQWNDVIAGFGILSLLSCLLWRGIRAKILVRRYRSELEEARLAHCILLPPGKYTLKQ